MDKNTKIWPFPTFPEITLRLISGALTCCDSHWSSGTKLHSDDFNRLYYVLDGAGVINGERGRVDLVPGCFFLIPGRYKFQYDCPATMRLLWIHFQLELLPGLDVFRQFRPILFYKADEDDVKNFKSMVDNITTGDPGEFLRMRADLLRLIEPFMPEDWNSIHPDRENVERLKPALELLRNRYNQTFDLSATAKVVNMHASYMSELFRLTFGVSPSAYVMDLRLSRAQNLLLTTDRRISDIAAECGFEDPLYFSRAFRKRCRYSPREFRRKQGI